MQPTSHGPIVLVSMDGVGVAPPGPANAITAANTPNLDQYWPKYPHTYLEASGIYVGLPADTDGNSEVGHTTMGAGKVIFQDLARIDNAIQNKSFYQNPELKEAFAHAKRNNSNVHLIGLVGEGKTHASIQHLYALLKLAQQEKCDPDSLYIHAITDGRDSPPDRAALYIEQLMDACIEQRIGRVASMVGRFYAMDRDRRWDRIETAYKLYTKAEGHVVIDYKKHIKDSYKKKITDEYLEPTLLVVNENDLPVRVQANDAIIFFNYRPDRAIELTTSFVEEKFTGFERDLLGNIHFVGMTKYADDLPKHAAFPPDKAEYHLGRVLSDQKKKQLRIAESEKFAHVTYFFNNGYRGTYPGETQIEVPSPKDVVSYDKKPEMSQRWVADILLEKLATEKYDFVLVNFAGPDMVGHTGDFEATKKSMEVVDECLGRIVTRVLEMNGTVIVTADHGNAEEMVDGKTEKADRNHSTNPVPCIIINNDLHAAELPVGGVADIAPTVLGFLDITPPAEMTGRNLLANYQ